MTTIPVGAEVNLGLQLSALALLVVGLAFAIRAHRRIEAHALDAERAVFVHKNIMTAAILLAGLGLILWMLPNFLYGWFYGTAGLGYGTGGYSSYFGYGGQSWPHGYYLAVHIVLGSVAAVLAVYLLIRMRWSGFPEVLAVRNFRAVMIITWVIWVVNAGVGMLVFYYFAYLQTG